MALQITLLEDTNLLSPAFLKTDLKTAKKNQEGEKKKKKDKKKARVKRAKAVRERE